MAASPGCVAVTRSDSLIMAHNNNPANLTPDAAIRRLSALGQDVRYRVLEALRDAGSHGVSVGDMARRNNVAGPTISVHLNLVVDAGLARSERRKQSVFYIFEPDAIRQLSAHLANHFESAEEARINTAA